MRLEIPGPRPCCPRCSAEAWSPLEHDGVQWQRVSPEEGAGFVRVLECQVCGRVIPEIVAPDVVIAYARLAKAERVVIGLLSALGYDLSTTTGKLVRSPFRGLKISTGGRPVRFITAAQLAELPDSDQAVHDFSLALEELERGDGSSESSE